jgi:two-component system cell cycle response regulator DivK
MAGELVLVVEDNEKNMKLFRDVLQATGYQAVEATSGEDAIEVATAQRPALVLLDVQLPVVALTAQAMSGDRERFLEAGFDGYLSKPVDVGELIRVVQEWFSRD